MTTVAGLLESSRCPAADTPSCCSSIHTERSQSVCKAMNPSNVLSTNLRDVEEKLGVPVDFFLERIVFLLELGDGLLELSL